MKFYMFLFWAIIADIFISIQYGANNGLIVYSILMAFYYMFDNILTNK